MEAVKQSQIVRILLAVFEAKMFLPSGYKCFMICSEETGKEK